MYIKYKRLCDKVQDEILLLHKYESGKVMCIKCLRYYFLENKEDAFKHSYS